MDWIVISYCPLSSTQDKLRIVLIDIPVHWLITITITVTRSASLFKTSFNGIYPTGETSFTWLPKYKIYEY